MNFKMNIVVCATILMIMHSEHAVYNWDWVKGKPVRHDRRDSRDIMSLLRSADRLPVEHYGELMAMLLNLPKQDGRDILFEPSRALSVLTARDNTAKQKCLTARPPIAPYGDLTATLLGLPAVDNRDISFEPTRPVAAPVIRKNEPIKSCSSARKPCIVVNGTIVYCLDKMAEESQLRRAVSPKK